MRRRYPSSHYLNIAREIRSIAQELPDMRARQNLEALAADYERMATEAADQQLAGDDDATAGGPQQT